MEEERLAELERLANAATPGPWFWDDGEPGSVLLSAYEGPELPGFPMAPTGDGKDILDDPGVLHLDTYVDEDAEGPSNADRAFIVTARTAIPELIAEVRWLTERASTWKQRYFELTESIRKAALSIVTHSTDNNGAGI